ncbi:hypothetical protein HYI19_07570 [Clostridium botulinum]|uniref:hypothetical protein n=1 Tax=Clostridium botulinum TaxID=1491 RepID=UPI0013FBAD09|nr:hypothetical protein [Clostridium botulinum]MBY6844659.1 hypothetical protein [Clostridium botulinum]NFB57636.1 hypothetical protein [Clostridium botulinum]NFB61765.1 hypothetical protein [Clostridium botulinum]
MDYNDISNDILLKAYKKYLDGTDVHKVEIPWNDYQSLYNEAINYLTENGLIAIKARTIGFAKISLTSNGISCASAL